MSKRDRDHFDQYTEQNRAKHRILSEYLPAYFTALKNVADGYHFIDAFAGRGSYEGTNPGSPLLALESMADAGALGRSTISCVEAQSDFAKELDAALAKSEKARALRAAPFVGSGAFHDHIDAILRRDIYKAPGDVATFAFVDPCGVEGVQMADLARLLSMPFGEILLLFNYDGVNRLLGGIERGTHDDAILVALFGSKQRLEMVRSALKRRPSEKELVIREEFCAALRQVTGVRYSLPFRFKAKTTERPSHYLLHCCNSPLAFKIMKDVMWETGKSEHDKYGRLEFLGDHERGMAPDLLREDIEAQKKRIADRVRQVSCQVSVFKIDWVSKPTDSFSERVYGQMLLDLEAAGQVLVYDKQNKHPAPASVRRRYRGKPTLAGDYWLRAP
jgi:three-Cys-motif partner protein